MSVRPLHDWMVVEVDKPAETTAAGIILVREPRILTGRILAIGPGKWNGDKPHRIPTGLEEGDRVAFFRENLLHKNGKQLARTVQELEGTDARIGLLRVPDVLGKVVGEGSIADGEGMFV